jgi:hypothetical protein
MRLPVIALAAALAGMLLAAAPAQAAYSFGTDEALHTLVDVGVKGENNEDLMLGYKTSTQSFLLPYAIHDDGYVLIVKSDHEKYYDIPADMLPQWQKAGLVPDPLPPYQLSAIDVAMGYILWPTLVLIAVVWYFSWRRQQRQKAAAAAAGTTPAAPEDKGPIT